MPTNTFDVLALEKLLLDLGYKSDKIIGNYQYFIHDDLQIVKLSTSGSYQPKQVREVVMNKARINSYEKFCKMFSQFK